MTLAATMVPALSPVAALADSGPSVPLPGTPSVPVQQETHKSRGEDAASRNALHNDQPARSDKEGSGTPQATSLSPSATWDVSTHTGDFSWSYPLRVPPAPGGLEPSLALSYSSSAVDGHTSATNNQPSWIGDGWDLWPGFIERSYGSCADDDANTADLCWRSDNATAAYNGGGGMLICCDSANRWRSKNDDGSRIERIFDANLRNGDKDGEYWRITTVDGTQYFFGSQADSGATWTVPVFGDDANEPCHAPTFEASQCVQGWRWNLDKIVDRNGNVIRYYYDTESNKYGLNGKDAGVDYIRGGTLNHIDYGLNEGAAGPASGRVDFTPADRCVPGSDCTPSKKDNWPDTPWDQKCDTATCTKHFPSFWSTKRLATITTKVWNGSTYDPVEEWTLDQQFPDPGDGKAALWLKGITHTGLAHNNRVQLEPVTFEGTQLANRVDGAADGYSPLFRYRLSGIVSEAGGAITITYAQPDCRAGQTMPAETNTLRCFPVSWAPPGHAQRTDYFHKYVVDTVIQSDMLSSSPEQTTKYEYLDGAAWHWDMSEFTKDKDKTWNEFRGFKRVRVRTGDPGDPAGPVSMTEERFYRGMNGDRLNPQGGSKPVTVSDSDGGSRTDDDWLQGFGYESTTYDHEAPSNQPDPPVVSRTITDPTKQGPTATRGAYQAYIVAPGTERELTALAAGGWRVTKTVTGYDDRGLPTTVNDLGDLGTAADDRCTRTTYDRNVNTWQLDSPGEVEIVAVNCDTTPRFPDNAISATRYGYDAKGNQARTDVAKARPAAAPDYVTTGTATYDLHGRVKETTNALGKVTRTAYTPATGGPVTETSTTTPPVAALPKGLTITSTLDPAFGLPTKETDPNGRVTQITYDALGRVAEAWLPNRSASQGGSVRYTYQIRRTAPSVITTSKLGPNGEYAVGNTLYDGLLRPRQTQQPSVRMVLRDNNWVPINDGRLIVDTRYDTHGRVYKTTQPYFNSAAPDTNVWSASDAAIPGLNRTRFDGADRPIESIYQAGTEDKWKTVTSYGGDRVHTTPPAGGTATTTITNARGQTTELRQYHGPIPAGDYDTTGYKYAPAGQLAEVTGPDGAVSRYGYDLRGRKISATDPDAGTTALGYDDADRLTSTKDSMGRVLVTNYDDLDRRTELREDDGRTGTLLARWTYDTAPGGRGLPAGSTRFVGGQAYTGTVDFYSALSKPLQTSVIIPGVEGVLADTYSTTFTYAPDGTLDSERYPGVRNVTGALTVSHAYDDWGRPTSTRTGAGAQLVANTYYTRYGEIERLEQGSTGKHAWQSFYFDTSTRRPVRSVVDAEVAHVMQSDTHYTYDQAGTITSMADLTLEQPTDIQCFRTDHLRRVTEAWTPNRDAWSESAGCTRDPSNVLSGPAPYWHTYAYDKGGNRVSETRRTPTTSTTRTYTYGGSTQPHTLRSVESPAGSETYGYNAVGQNTTRAKPGTDQTLNWDREGHLASASGGTSFVYSPGGSRLIRKDPGGTTLYLGNEEVRLAAGASTPTVTRYYTHAGSVVAMESGSALTYLAADHQGSTQVAVDAGSLAATRRRQLPYGAPRGEPVSWPNEHGFVGGTTDSSTGLTHLGAREYDPALGQFIADDPITVPGDPQQINGYSYANNNPVTFNDASGLVCSGPDGIGCRSPVSKEGYGDQRNPANRERYENDRKRWLQNTTQKTLRNGNGVRCPDGEKRCKPAAGAEEAQQRRKKLEGAARSAYDDMVKKAKGPSTGSPPSSVEQALMFLIGELSNGGVQSISTCLETTAGALFWSVHTERCVNIDIYGKTESYEEKSGTLFGAGVSAGVSLKFNSKKADEVATKLEHTVSYGFDLQFVEGVDFEVESDVDHPVDEGSRATLKYAAGLKAAAGCYCHSTKVENSGYKLRW